jgi:serine/threonine-protein kinase
MPVVAAEATLPPSSRSAQRVCPLCRKRASEFPGLVTAGSELPRCPDHGLPFVDLRDGSDPLLGTTIAGRFTILGKLGSGSMGAVYRARQDAVGRDVALKLVRRDRAHDPETKGRFEREARAISALVSPHTVTAFDFGEAEDGAWFLAMEMLEGETVGERLRRVGPFEWSDALRFTRDALKSLAEAHAKGIIHRDLKPDNLFLSRAPAGVDAADRDVCKVLDFGIAKWSGDDEAMPIDQLETQAGTVFGTPRYMSPEQAQGSLLDARSDLYSLGVLLYQMLSGRAPFIDDDAVVVMARHIKDEPPHFRAMTPPVVVPERIEAVLWRVLAKSPADRPSSAEQLIAELDEAEASVRALESGPRQTVIAQRSELSQRLALIALLIVAVVTVLAGLALWLRRPASSSTQVIVVASPSAPPLESSVSSAAVSSPSEAVISLENSSVEPPAGAPATSGAGASKRMVAPRPRVKPSLQKKGNERYGRFD